ncbi:hypothetical protein [Legionella gresilensis]|uniref:hypothetical protein n=1 Tax=Legionella gresilensis TaxID=91823 RepID=UPI0010419181|nr:hypothetical protein [Legionella gresilensis]
MSTCEVCGNNYQHAFEIHKQGKVYTFDCFECAIHKLAPHCKHCDCQIIGHGIAVENDCFCCAHCAREAGFEGAKDNVQA